MSPNGKQPTARESRALEAFEFCQQIAPDGVVHLPTHEYLASALGWPAEDAITAIQDLMASGQFERTAPGVYRLTA